LKFTFRTTVADTHIVSTENILSQVQFAASITHGYLLGNFSGFVSRRLLPFPVNDDRWYTLLFNNTNKSQFLESRTHLA
uniref:LAM_G_DOMAIN domain-containing protein n=1 Tax=Gongylonema pulchrum TaxID=637853 RepID=A0A183DDS8_9BILA